jgi:MFS family permease
VLHEGAAGFGFLTSARGIGALVGALGIASISHLGPRPSLLFGGGVALAAASLLLAYASHFAIAAVLLAIAGASIIVCTATANTSLQITAPDHLRGRMMGVYSIITEGLIPVGSLISGGLAQVWGAPVAFGVGGAVGLLAAIGVWHWHVATRAASVARVAGAADQDRIGSRAEPALLSDDLGTVPRDEE